MKKKLTLLLAAMMLFCGGCGSKDTAEDIPAQEIQTEFYLEECGLSYTIPESWTTTENTNLIPSSYVDASNEIYARIQYHYAPNENLAELNNTDSETPIEELMTPLFELLVVKEENLETAAVQAEFALFNSKEELEQQENFHFYFLTDYADGIAHFSDEAQETFRTLEKDLPLLLESIETFLPDEASVVAAAEENGKYIAFLSNTLEGDAINSTIFYEYDMTVVNFWASYCLPDINELAELQSFYTDLQKKHPNVNFIQVVIDTPAEQAEQDALAAYQKAGVTFTGIMPDQTLAGWIMENLNGLPTTIFVDSTGKPSDTKIEGMQDADYYMQSTENMLKAMTK